MDNIDLSESQGAYLPHGPKHLITTPFWKPPIIIVLFDSSYANSTVAATAAAQEPPTRDMALTTIQSGLVRCEDVPVGLILVVHRPAVRRQRKEMAKTSQLGRDLRSGHVHVVHLGTILSCFEDEDLCIWVL